MKSAAITSIIGGLALSCSFSAFATPLLPGDSVEVSNRAGNAFTPAPVAGDANGLYQNVTFRLDEQRNVRASAGMFVLDYQQVGSNAWNEFYSFCLEPDVYLMPFSNPYAVDALADSGYRTELAELWGRYFDQVDSDLAAAAFQVSIWELSYDGDRSLDSGSFQLVANDAVHALASTWLSSIDGTGTQASGLLVLGNDPGSADRQDLLTQAVPEPGTLAMLPLALLAMLRRRTRR
ncbi:MAG: PEP-CTERM sorting domain-containing protein [Pseudomonadales bacterium]